MNKQTETYQHQPKIAIVASRGLGDGLLFLIIANNLQKNGYDVTFYSNFVSQMQDWIPSISIKPFPKDEDINNEFANYDIVLADASSVITHACPKSKYKNLAKQYIFLSMSRFNKDLICEDYQQVTKKITNKHKLQKLLPLFKASGSLISNMDDFSPMTDRITIFCKQVLGLHNVTNNNSLRAPSNLKHRLHKHRIIIHPTSSNVAKNWHANKFIKLARKLQAQGWEPTFIVSPDEKPTWEKIVNKEFPMPIFTTIKNLATFIYESGFMIGNDSGIAHLASNLNIPTLTIVKSTKKSYRWRPGWALGEIVNAPFNPKFRGKYYWQYLIPVKKVYNAFIALVNSF